MQTGLGVPLRLVLRTYLIGRMTISKSRFKLDMKYQGDPGRIQAGQPLKYVARN